MKGKFKIKSIPEYWENHILTRVSEWQAETKKSILNRHSFILAGLLVLCIFQYYADKMPFSDVSFFRLSFFTGIHDVNRVLFLIPIIYAAIIFRVRGSVITSFIFLVVVLPRAFFISTYPNPLYRAVAFVIVSALVGFLVAAGLNRIEREKKNRIELSSAYDRLNEYTQKLKESQEQLMQADKLTSLGQLAASIAHELNNPLSGILVYTQLLQKKIAGDTIPKGTVLEYLSKMEIELVRSTKLVQNLLNFARQSPPAFRQVDLNIVVNRAFELAAHTAKIQHIQTIKELDPSLPGLIADFDQLQQVCTNLILNAIQAMPDGGKLTLRTSYSDSWFKVEVRDTGSGISRGNLPKLFTPFFTTKHEIKGVGLGLAVSYGIIQRHYGRIEVQSQEGEGTIFTLYLPVHQIEEKQP
jgi:signal transduction histidine kinase